MQLTRLGPYEIEKPLGKGGMGSVYSATDTQTGQRVAIKALAPQLAMAEGFRERFEAEIESLKTLRHDGIVHLFGYGEQDGVLFYSMELVNGISLEDELRAGRRFNWREVTNIAVQLSLALKHAHDHGIIHRDIKPANILLYNEERVKLADFGIARLFGTTSLTTAGGVLGTADYMSPEQADGRPVTARCDQYSLGGVMYALLAGRPPFRANNLPQMLQLQRFANPEPVRRYAPDTPEQLERVVSQLLSKDPADRFPNTQVLARHLQAMTMALSRPASDDFALASDHSAIAGLSNDENQSIAIERTQSASDAASSRDGSNGADRAARTGAAAASQNAATLAAEEVAAKEQSGLAASAVVPGAEANRQPALVRPSRFTTLEEDEARRRAEYRRSWVVFAGQLAVFAAVLAGIVGIAWYLSRPASADKLYSSIMSRIDAENGTSLATVERELTEFLARYPEDPRAATIQGFKERLELDQMEHKLQRQGRSSTATIPSTSPAEQLYLRAVGLTDSSPDEALAVLESLVNLYGAQVPEVTPPAASNVGKKKGGERDESARTSEIVEQARRRIKTLRADLARLREGQLATLAERLDAAERLTKKDASQAAGIYQAIIDIYQKEPWAAAVVAKARRGLAELKK
jgi:serine/threonine protein kinase